MKKLKMYIKIISVILCTVIGVYGVFAAPPSEQSELQSELRHNAHVLKQAASTPYINPTPVNTSDIPYTTQLKEQDNSGTISVIGDSVFLGAAPAFQKIRKNAVIDAKVSRQVYQAANIAKKMKKKGRLGNIVIISLGTNGPFNPATGQSLIDSLGSDRTIYWINVYGRNLDIQKSVNKTIKKLAKKNSNVHIIPWAKEGRKHSDWFYQDGIHLNAKGQNGCAKFLSDNIQDGSFSSLENS